MAAFIAGSEAARLAAGAVRDVAELVGVSEAGVEERAMAARQVQVLPRPLNTLPLKPQATKLRRDDCSTFVTVCKCRQ